VSEARRTAVAREHSSRLGKGADGGLPRRRRAGDPGRVPGEPGAARSPDRRPGHGERAGGLLMEPVHVSPEGAILAFILVASIVSLIGWMLRLPEQSATTRQVAKAIRLTERANRILVPVQGKALSDRLIALGSQMAKARQATMEVFYVVEVPWTLPLNANL